MYFEVLGPLRVTSDDGVEVTPSGRVQRMLLATLLIHVNRSVAADTLVEAIWPDDASGRAHARLHLAVHRLRGALESPSRISHDSGGYRIQVSEDEYDVFRFDVLAARILLVEEPTSAETTEIALEALALWRGRAFEDLAEVAATPEAGRCEARRNWVLEAWCEAEVARGRQGVVLADLELFAREQPFHERFQVLLMRALHADGRTAESLEVYSRSRAVLQEELGLDPGRELQEEHRRVLTGERPPGVVREEVPSPAQLPPHPAGLIGRRPDLDEIDVVLRCGGFRICVVTGTPGVGKTALGLAWAHRHRDDFPDGQLFVDLRGFSEDPPVEPVEALGTCLRSLGVDAGGMPTGLAERSALFRSLVAERRVLLILDNAGSSEQVRPLLPGGSSCAVLVTSRETLPGLGAREGARAVRLAPLTGAESDRLLVALVGERAQAEAAATRALGWHCGELPLALRIAAQQVAAREDRSMADVVSEIVDERDRLDLLDAGDGPATDIRAVLSWSYESLTDGPARVFRLLGMLSGADADEAALSALCDCDRRELRRYLDTLVRAHLLERGGDGRYRQHDLLRAYAGEVARRVEPPGALAAARSRLLRFYARTAAAVGGVLRREGRNERTAREPGGGPAIDFPDIASAQGWLDRERGNVVACVEAAEPVDAAPVFALGRAYTPRCHATSEPIRDDAQNADCLRLSSCELDLARTVGDVAAEHMALMGLGATKANLGDLDGAEAEFREAVVIAAENGDEPGRASAVGNLGAIAADRGYLARAGEFFAEAVEVFRHHEQHPDTVTGLVGLGKCGNRAGDHGRAERFFHKALLICEEQDLPLHRADALLGLAEAVLAQGAPERAERHAREAGNLVREVGAQGQEAIALAALGAACMAQGRAEEAQNLFRAAVPSARELGDVGVAVGVLRRYAAATATSEVATTMYREVLGYVAEHGFRGIEAELRVGFAGVLEDWGDTAAAVTELRRAQHLYRELGDPRAGDAAARLEMLSPLPT